METKSFTLVQLFEVWGQPLGTSVALNYHGPVAVLVNGMRFSGDPGSVQLLNLDNIVLELGRPPPTPAQAMYDFARLSR